MFHGYKLSGVPLCRLAIGVAALSFLIEVSDSVGIGVTSGADNTGSTAQKKFFRFEADWKDQSRGDHGSFEEEEEPAFIHKVHGRYSGGPAPETEPVPAVKDASAGSSGSSSDLSAESMAHEKTAASAGSAAAGSSANHGSSCSGSSCGYDEGDTDAAIQARRGTALVLLGGFFVVVSLFYLLNFPDKDVGTAVWKTLSDVTSLFCAILIYEGTNAAMHVMFGEDLNPTCTDMTSRFTRSFMSFLLLEIALGLTKNHPMMLISWGQLNAHVTGFFCLDYFGGLQQCEPYNQSPGWAFLVVIIASVTMGGMVYIGSLIRTSIVQRDDGGEDHETVAHAWHHECEESEDEAMAFCLGLLISQVIRFCLVGKLPPIAGYPKYKTYSQVKALLVIALTLGVVGVAFDFLRHHLRHQRSRHHFSGLKGKVVRLVERMSSTLQQVLAFTMGWCLVFWGKWMFYFTQSNSHALVRSNKMLGSMALTVLFSCVCYAMIIIVFIVTSRKELRRSAQCLRSILEGFVLCMGFYWEKLFFEALDGIQPREHTENGIQTFVLMTFIICVLLLPAWSWYILPKGLECHGAHEEHHGEEGHGQLNNGPKKLTSADAWRHLLHQYHKTTVSDEKYIVRIQRKFRKRKARRMAEAKNEEIANDGFRIGSKDGGAKADAIVPDAQKDALRANADATVPDASATADAIQAPEADSARADVADTGAGQPVTS